MSIKDIVALLGAVGLSSPPAWLRPYRTLSNGEAFRASIARALAESGDLVVIDEFTSVVDRQVAKVAGMSGWGSACHDDQVVLNRGGAGRTIRHGVTPSRVHPKPVEALPLPGKVREFGEVSIEPANDERSARGFDGDLDDLLPAVQIARRRPLSQLHRDVNGTDGDARENRRAIRLIRHCDVAAGEDAAVKIWASGATGEASAPHRATRRAAAATSTRSRGSGTTTTRTTASRSRKAAPSHGKTS
ncbi:hypothetical protein [Nonomuraea sp. NPDC049750]|uniref:hypothetical protein n=1 Tax=Nonomuraea sp. NPDC049750 TaxID=3154738 RepID=UPI0033D74B5B